MDFKSKVKLKRNGRTYEQCVSYANKFIELKKIKHSNYTIGEENIEIVWYSNISYDALVQQLIREKYSDGDEYKLHREAFINGVNDEFMEYNNYVEECKVKAKQFIEERESVL